MTYAFWLWAWLLEESLRRLFLLRLGEPGTDLVVCPDDRAGMKVIRGQTSVLRRAAEHGWVKFPVQKPDDTSQDIWELPNGQLYAVKKGEIPMILTETTVYEDG